MTEYLKEAPWTSKAVGEEVRRTVSEMLLRIDADPEAEVRRFSRELDGWNPPSFRVDAAAIEAATEALDEELRMHIAFAQDQIRRFAEAQRATLQDLEIETFLELCSATATSRWTPSAPTCPAAATRCSRPPS